MKKTGILIICLALTMSLAVFAGETKEKGGSVVDITYCVPDTANPFVGWLTGADTEVYDVMMNINQYNCGEQIAKWVSAGSRRPSQVKEPMPAFRRISRSW